jgi:hypothetical protein
MENKMDLWNRVKTSDPKYLKKVSFGSRHFTAIDPQYQVRSATEQFGPVGDGWGWHADSKVHHLSNGDAAIISDVTIWHGTQANTFGPFPGCRKLFDAAKGRLAEDAPKMSVTDGLTKGLSHLGFNADVFLGEMDGNKYASDSKKTGNEEEGW